MSADILAEYRDDEGRVRAHRHSTYVQTAWKGKPPGQWYFPVCCKCGPLTKEDFATEQAADMVAAMHHRNSGIVVRGF